MGIEQKPHHILKAQQFSRSWLEDEFFPEADRMKNQVNLRLEDTSLSNRTVCLLFYEPSTRTRLSFHQAALKLGAKVAATENAKDFSSAIKGESLKDTIRVMNSLHFDAVVLRHFEEGAAEEAASVSKAPIINGGDGPGQHPTQALLDLYTIRQNVGSIDGVRVALAGDLKNGRTIRSLAYLLSKFDNVWIDMVAPPGFQIGRDILEHLDEHQIKYNQVERLEVAAGEADAIYVTRLQTERLTEEEKRRGVDGGGVRVDENILGLIKNDAIIMHPLPRNEEFGELPERLISHPQVVPFDQVESGLFTRMALLKMLLS